MKRLFTILIAVLFSVAIFAQTPQKMSYQAVIRNSSNALVISTPIGMQISILQGTSTGTPVYVETQAPTTNANGLVTIEIGGGTIVSGSFTGIDWTAGPYFIKTEIAVIAPLTTYTITGTTQLLSVPYALHASTVSSYAETDPIFSGWNRSTGITIPSTQISDFSAAVTNTPAVLLNTAKITNATHTGDATGSTALTVVRINGVSLAGLPTGLLKNTTGTGAPSIAVAGTDYLAPNGSAAALTNFPILNQNTTGNAATVTTNANLTGMVTSVGNVTTVVTNANLTGDVISTGNATTIANKITMTATAPVSITGSPTVIASGAVAISIAAATPSTAGSMSAADKTKLDGIAPPTHIIGESYGGGIIFYLDASGKHGLIAATTDQTMSIQWYNGTFTNTTAFASSIGGGDGNTSMIVFNQGNGPYAAQLCYDLNTGGFNDWYLPSKYELNLMYQNIGQGNLLGLGNVGGFANDYYWSSTEGYSGTAWFQFFANGDTENLSKDAYNYVRAIRAF